MAEAIGYPLVREENELVEVPDAAIRQLLLENDLLRAEIRRLKRLLALDMEAVKLEIKEKN